MPSSARVSVEDATQTSGDTATCVVLVRGREGALPTGHVSETAITRNGDDPPVSLRVVRILRFKEVPFFDPPHAAKLELTGPGAGTLQGFTHLLVSQPGQETHSR